MKNALIVVGTLALATASFACSSSDKAEAVDTQQALSALRAPTGSLSAKNGASIFSGYKTQRADSKKVSAPSGAGNGGSSSRTQSLRFLNSASNADAACADGQSCSCPSGGSMTAAHESSPDGALLRVEFDSCGFGDGSSFDGNAILLLSNKSILGLSSSEGAGAAPPSKPGSDTSDTSGTSGSGATPADGTGLGDLEEAPDTSDDASSQGYAALLLAARGTVTEAGQSAKIEFALLTEASYAFLAVKVEGGGHVVIGVADDGRAIIKSVEGTWHCNPSARGYVCKSDGGESLDIAGDGGDGEGEGEDGARASGPSAPSAPSAPSGSNGSDDESGF